MKLISSQHKLGVRYWLRLTITSILFAISASALAKSTLPEFQHYAGDWEYGRFRISPDGDTLAYINRQRGEDNVVVLNIKDMSLKAGFNSPDAQVDAISFLTNDHLIVDISDYRRTRIGRDKFIFNISNNEKIKLGWGSSVSSNSFSSGWMKDYARGVKSIYGVNEKSAKIAMGLLDKYRSVGLYLADLETGKSSLIERGTSETSSWMVDSQNNPLIRVDIDRDNNKTKFFVKKDSWQLLLSINEIWDFRIAMSENQDKLHIFKDKLNFRSVLSVSLADGSKEYSLSNGVDRDARYFINNRKNDLIAVIYGGLKPYTRFTNVKIDSAFQKLSSSFAGSEVLYISGEDSLEKIIVSISGEDSAFDYFLFNTSTLSLARLKSARPNIKHMARRESLTYMSSDGTTIPAVLRLPVTTDANTKIPLIVIPHRYGLTSSIGFERDADFFSAKGYAVFSPNYRSTGGFGLELRDADIDLRNDLILQDIDDGIEFLSKNYSLDMKKIHAIGYGYGGYLVLMSAANYPNRYKSIAVVDPITDLSDFPDYMERTRNGMFPQLKGSDAMIKELSPINYASQFKAHVLLISDKSSAYHRQVKNMNKRLKSESKAVRLEIFKTKHGNRDAEAREKVLEEIESFLEI